MPADLLMFQERDENVVLSFEIYARPGKENKLAIKCTAIPGGRPTTAIHNWDPGDVRSVGVQRGVGECSLLLRDSRAKGCNQWQGGDDVGEKHFEKG